MGVLDLARSGVLGRGPGPSDQVLGATDTGQHRRDLAQRRADRHALAPGGRGGRRRRRPGAAGDQLVDDVLGWLESAAGTNDVERLAEER